MGVNLILREPQQSLEMNKDNKRSSRRIILSFVASVCFNGFGEQMKLFLYYRKNYYFNDFMYDLCKLFAINQFSYIIKRSEKIEM